MAVHSSFQFKIKPTQRIHDVVKLHLTGGRQLAEFGKVLDRAGVGCP